MGRPHYIMDKVWQMMQSKDTKTLNLDKDFEEFMNKAKQAGWNESSKTKRFWIEEDEDQQLLLAMHSNPQMERIMNFVAEWFSLDEDEGAARCLYVDVCFGMGVAV